jgi:predicted nicotinamide N-methyase
MSTSPSLPSPALFLQTVRGYTRSAALKAAIELDVFTAIGEGNTRPADIARRCQASERGIRILCDNLCMMGLITKRDLDYALTQDTALFLDKRSPMYLGGAVEFLNSTRMMEGFWQLADAVRQGRTALPADGSVTAENPLWVDFARYMGPLMRMPADMIAKLVRADAHYQWKVLDLAAGHGIFGIAIAQHNPNAQIVAVDWPRVLEVAQENAAAAGVTERYRIVPGSAFEVDFGEGYDLVLINNFLHHFDRATCEALLAKAYAALKRGGSAVAFEFVPNDDRISPVETAVFSLVMLATTPSGDAYTFSEFEDMFAKVGFAGLELHQVPPTPQQVLTARKF